MAVKTHIYRDNRNDMYRKAGKQVSNTARLLLLLMRSIGTSSALARNKTHLVSDETHLVSFEVDERK